MRDGGNGIMLSVRDRKALEAWVDRPGVPLNHIIRAWIILLSAAGQPTANIAARLGVSNSTVLLWRARFQKGGISALAAEKKKIERPRNNDEEIRKIVEATLNDFPERARRWSIRNMARFMGVSRSTIQRIWKRYGLKPQSEEFKFRHDPRFYEDCKDLAGLYIESPQVYAVALLTEEAPVAASSGNDGADPDVFQRVIRGLRAGPARRPSTELVDFLKWVNNHTPPESIVHLIVPRQAQSTYPQAFRWLKRHPRFQLHVIPRGMSGRQFLTEWHEKTEEAARTRKTFRGLADLHSELSGYAAARTATRLSPKKLASAKPFLWVRPDRNYQTDENQLELNLSAS